MKGELKGMLNTRMFLSTLSLAGMLIVPATLATAGQGDDKGKQVTVTGCLNSGQKAGEFVITDEITGKQTVLSGAADLSKHSANHKVRITGTKSDSAETVVVSKVEHIADTCTAPGR